ncbi:hypothetical protein GC176_20555 [bacterium]|nr:hypothetical protein [bacterium]
MDSLYDLQIDLSTNDGGLPRDQFKDWMRVRLFGHSTPRKVSLPALCGSIYFINDGGEDVSIRRGVSLPIKVSRGEIVHVMIDGANMRRVGGY